MKQVENLKIESGVSVDDRTKIFNSYAEGYNNTADRIGYTANLITIRNGFKEHQAARGDDIKSRIETFSNKLERVHGNILLGKYGFNKDAFSNVVVESIVGYSRPEISDYNSNAEVIKGVIDHLSEYLEYVIKGIKFGTLFEDEVDHLKAQFKWLFEALPDVAKESIWEPYFSLLEDTFKMSNNWANISTHITTLNFLINEIPKSRYEKELTLYEDLSDSEKEEIRKPGAPLKDDVPQNEIEEIVKECIKDSSNRRFIHQNGSHKGKANKNQIWEHIVNNYPEFDKEMSKRQLLRRIKKALPFDMT